MQVRRDWRILDGAVTDYFSLYRIRCRGAVHRLQANFGSVTLVALGQFTAWGRVC